MRIVVRTGIDDRDVAAADDVADGTLEGERAGIIGDQRPHPWRHVSRMAGNEVEYLIVGDVVAHAGHGRAPPLRTQVLEKDGAPVPGSPGLQAISFDTSREVEIALTSLQTTGQNPSPSIQHRFRRGSRLSRRVWSLRRRSVTILRAAVRIIAKTASGCGSQPPASLRRDNRVRRRPAHHARAA